MAITSGHATHAGCCVYSIYQSPLDISRCPRIHAGWAKLMAAGLEYVDDAQHLLV
ncbi:MAG: hypothetical protein IPK19_13080 [Chloroflexi bacterium]|nr:hypothetical protein [Chloroflexota bacterium]